VQDDLSKSSAPLLSVVLSGLGLLVDVMVFFLAIGTLEFALAYLLVIGLGLGIAGMVLGIKGIKNYKRKRKAGVKHTSELVLSIVGLYLAVGAILFAFIFGVFTYFFYLFNI
jgi:hypothetical protein